MKRRLALLTALCMTAAMTGHAATQDGEPAPEPASTPTVTSTPEPAATAEPTSTPEPTATAEPTPTPEPAATAEPTSTPEPTATAEPTPTPEPSSTPEPTATAEPASTPEPTATAEPTSTPSPTATPGATLPPVKIPENVGPGSSAEDILLVQGWLCELGYLTEDMLTGVYDDATMDAVTEFQKALMESGAAGIDADGLCDRATLEAMYAMIEQDAPQQPGNTDRPEKPGGQFPGGNRPGGSGGGSRPSGGSSGTAGQSDLSATGGVTPGKAVTSSHVSGDGDMSLYGSSPVETLDEAAAEIAFEGKALGVALREAGNDSLLPCIVSLSEDGGQLIISCDQAEYPLWTVDGMALRTLERSGCAYLTLTAGGVSVTLPTSGLLSGETYDRLRAKGVTDNTLIYSIRIEGGVPEFTVTARDEVLEAASAEDGPLYLTGVSVSADP